MPASLDELLVTLRPRLLAYLCRIGDPAEAEDRYGELALRALRNPPGAGVRDVSSWLFGVARHVAYATERPFPVGGLPRGGSLQDDLESEVLWEALASLLGTLNPEERGLLIDHYGAGIEFGDLASRYGGGAGTLAARAARLRRRLLDGLTTEQRATFAAFGVPVPTRLATEIWCPRCGESRLTASLPDDQKVALKCAKCEEGELFLAEGRALPLVSGTPRVALRRFLDLARRNLLRWRGDGGHRCPSCGTMGSVEARAGDGQLECRCTRCPHEAVHPVWELALATPPAREFWRRHDRIVEMREADGIRWASWQTGEEIRFKLCARTGLPVG